MRICNVCDEEDENVEIYFEADSKGRGLVRIGGCAVVFELSFHHLYHWGKLVRKVERYGIHGLRKPGAIGTSVMCGVSRPISRCEMWNIMIVGILIHLNSNRYASAFN